MQTKSSGFSGSGLIKEYHVFLIEISWGNHGSLSDNNRDWRTAFNYAIGDWNNTSVPFEFFYLAGSENWIDAQYLPDVQKIAWAWKRRSIAAHEVGHMHAIGHIPFGYPKDVLMRDGRTNEERERIISPQEDDIYLINQVYP